MNKKLEKINALSKKDELHIAINKFILQESLVFTSFEQIKEIERKLKRGQAISYIEGASIDQDTKLLNTFLNEDE